MKEELRNLWEEYIAYLDDNNRNRSEYLTFENFMRWVNYGYVNLEV